MQLPAGITSKFGRQILTLQKNAPTILFAGGITAGVTSTVLACKATLQLETKLSIVQDEIAVVRLAGERVASGEPILKANGEAVDYTAKDAKRDLAIVYTRGIVSLIRLYAPAIGAGVLSVALLTKSQHILHERNAGLAAAYAAVDKAFRGYRERVVAEQGHDKDLEYLHGTEEVEEINPETGRKKKVTKFGAMNSPYAKFFDDSNRNYHSDPDYNLTFLIAQQNYANDRLQAIGHLFLNEVYSMLGLPHTRAGAVVGWIKGEGDNFVDFNIYEGRTQAGRDFVNGKENAILLDFNVVGEMWNRIDESGDTTWLS